MCYACSMCNRCGKVDELNKLNHTCPECGMPRATDDAICPHCGHMRPPVPKHAGITQKDLSPAADKEDR